MGFDQSLFVEPVDCNLKCGVCQDILDTPMNACEEGHTFCKDCLLRAIKKGCSNCPTCRGDLLPSPVAAMRCGARSTQVAPARKKLRSSATVKTCCDWVGPVSEFKDHRNKCEFIERKGPLGCRKTFVMSAMEHHTNEECGCRVVTCHLCQREMKHKLLERHLKHSCQEMTIPCQFCGEEHRRKNLRYYGPKQEEYSPGSNGRDLEGHYKTCEKLPLKCQFHKYGCRDVNLTHENILAHHAEKADYHAFLVHKTFQQVNHRFEWQKIRITWEISKSKLEGCSARVLKSASVTVADNDFYLKLKLGGSNEPVVASICAKSPLWNLVQIEDIEIVLDDLCYANETNYSHSDSTALEQIDGSFDYEFVIPSLIGQVRVASNDDSDSDGDGDEYVRQKLTRSDLINRADEDEINIIASFAAQKLANVIVKCV